MSVVNWGEVYYSLVKRVGLIKTDTMMSDMAHRVPISLVSVKNDDAIRAARLKAQYNLPSLRRRVCGGTHRQSGCSSHRRRRAL